MTVRLYQFAISHYSEKVRWALDHKGIRYQPVNLLPGQHMATIRKLTGQSSSVPVLEHDKDTSNYEKYVERDDPEPAMAAGTSDEWADVF